MPVKTLESKIGIREAMFITTPLSVFVAVCSAAAGIAMLIIGGEGNYGAIAVLPFIYGLMCFISGRALRSIRKSPVTLFLLGGYFIRMVVTPLLFSLGGYQSFYKVSIASADVAQATLLLSLETVVVFLAANYYTSRITGEAAETIKLRKYKTRPLVCMTVLLVGFIVFAYIVVPAIQSIYLFLPTANIADLSKIAWDNETIVARGSIQRYIYSLFMFLWPIVRAILPALLISQIYKRYGNKTGGLVLSAFCLLIPSVLLGGDNIAPFLGVILGIFVMLRLYGRKARKIVIIAGILFLSAFIIILSSKLASYQSWRGGAGVASVAQILQAYFPGFDNMAIGFQIENPDKLGTFLFDLYYVIPFKETLLGLSGTSLADLYTQVSATGGQIVPWGFQVAHYFGIILSPLITGLFIRWAYRAEQKARGTDDFWRYYANMYTSVLIAISLSIYSFSIFLRSYINVIVPLLIIIRLGNRRKRKEIDERE